MHQKLSQILQDTLKKYNITDYSLNDDCTDYTININDNITIHEFPHAINTFEIIDRNHGMRFFAFFDDEYERLFRFSKYEIKGIDEYKLMNIRIPFIVLYNKIEASYEIYFYNEKNPYYEMDYPNCYINKDNRILLINFYEFKMVDLSDYYFYEIKHTKNQEDWHFNITVKQRNKILFNDEVTVIPDRGREYFVTKDNKSFTLDCIWLYGITELYPHTENALLYDTNNNQSIMVCYSKTPFKLIDMK